MLLNFILNQFHSVFTFLFLILFLSVDPSVEASDQKIEDSELSALLKTLAVDDDELRANTITSLAKSGDARLERFFELYR